MPGKLVLLSLFLLIMLFITGMPAFAQSRHVDENSGLIYIGAKPIDNQLTYSNYYKVRGV